MNDQISIKIDVQPDSIQKAIQNSMNNHVNAFIDNQDGKVYDLLLSSSNKTLNIHDQTGELVRTFSFPLRVGDFLSFLIQTEKRHHQSSRNKPRTHGIYQLIPHNMTFMKADVAIKLTDKEYDILHYLFDNLGRNVPRQEMLEKIWGYQAELDTHTLETHLYRLRKKIEQDPSRPQLLITNEDGYFLAL